MMNAYLYCVFLMLLMVFPLMGIPYEQTEEYAQKQAVLDERSRQDSRQKRDLWGILATTFSMQFTTISGSFKDIEVTAPQDTVFMRSVSHLGRVESHALYLC